jgi:glycerophosphoryl diester phosphodiesterase
MATLTKPTIFSVKSGYKYFVNAQGVDKNGNIINNPTKYGVAWTTEKTIFYKGQKLYVTIARTDGGAIDVSEYDNLLIEELESFHKEQYNEEDIVSKLHFALAGNDGGFSYGTAVNYTRSMGIEFLRFGYDVVVRNISTEYGFTVFLYNDDGTTYLQDVALIEGGIWQGTIFEYTIPANTTFRLYLHRKDNVALGTLAHSVLDWSSVLQIEANTYNAIKKYVDIQSMELSKQMKSINHRGQNVLAPENTLPAFKISKQQGFDYVECDISFTSDNVPVLLHDDTINRTARKTDGSKLSSTISVASATYQSLLNYDFGIWKNGKYAGTKIPTFEQFISLCQKIILKPYVEIKSTIDADKVSMLFNILKKYNMVDEVTWISFNYDSLLLVKNHYNKARIGLVVSQPTSDLIDTKLLNLKTEENEVFLDFQNTYLSSINDAFISAFVENNIGLEVWTVNDESQLLSMNPYISGVTSDYIHASKVIYNANIN